MRLQTWYTPRGNLVAKGPRSVDHRVGPRPTTKAGDHQRDALTLLSAVDSATTGELAHCLELSAPYLSTLLERLVLEGRVETFKVGAKRHYRLP